jgi:hypothetical protein
MAPKFKVGDKVRCVKGTPAYYYATNKECIIKEICSDKPQGWGWRGDKCTPKDWSGVSFQYFLSKGKELSIPEEMLELAAVTSWKDEMQNE